MILGVKFQDFKNMADNHRVYYFRGKGFYDFHYVVDSIIVKTTVLRSDIENEQAFFSDNLFYGAVELTFRLPNPKNETAFDVDGIKFPDNGTNMMDFQDEEVKDEDIQRTGVEE